jgi:hypothetical protein
MIIKGLTFPGGIAIPVQVDNDGKILLGSLSYPHYF